MNHPKEFLIVWSDYLKYRAKLRGYDLATIESILRYSEEKYFDTVTRRIIVVGKHGKRLVMIPYGEKNNIVTPNHYPRYDSSTNKLPSQDGEV